MSIDPSLLNDVRPTSNAIDRLKNRMSRVKPWQTELVQKNLDSTSTSSASPATPSRISDPSLEGNNQSENSTKLGQTSHTESKGNNSENRRLEDQVSIEPKHDPKSFLIRKTEISESTKNAGPLPVLASAGNLQDILQQTILASTDTITTQSSINTDTIPTQNKKTFFGHNTDTVPTQSGYLEKNPLFQPVENTKNHEIPGTGIPTQKNFQIEYSDNRVDNTDTKSIVKGISSDPLDSILRDNEDDVSDNESRHNTDTNDILSRNIIGKNTDTKKNKCRHNAGTIPTQIDKNTDTRQFVPTQTRHNTSTIPTPNPTQNLDLTPLNTDTNSTLIADLQKQFLLLKRAPLRVMDHCCRYCLKHNSDSLKTTYDSLALATDVPIGSIRTTTKRLRDLRLIGIAAESKGPGAWIKISVPIEVLRISAQDFLGKTLNTDTIPTQTKIEYRHNTDTQSDTNLSSQSVSNFNNTNYLSTDELISVGFEAVEPLGITKSLISDFQKNKWSITKQQLEGHIERFAKWVTIDPKAKLIKNMRALFCSHIATIAKTGVDPLDYIQTEADIATEAILAQRKAMLHERLQKQQERMQVEFELWKMETSKAEIIKLVPENNFAKMGSEIYQKLLKSYFVENIWPTRSL